MKIENFFPKSEDTVYINIVDDPIFDIYDDVVMEDEDESVACQVKNSICDYDKNNFIKFERMSDGHVMAVREDGLRLLRVSMSYRRKNMSHIYSTSLIRCLLGVLV